MAIAPTELADWFDAYAASLVLYARQWVGESLAEDLVQEAFVKLATQTAAPASVKAWLIVSVRHAGLDALKTSRRRRDRDHQAGTERSQLFAAAPKTSALDAADVETALAALPPVEREIITLRIWTESTFQEIAGILKLPLSTVYQQYRSGIESMRSRWESPCRKT
jgi:RNA polymerase sigma-70 factor (ECF subfamily)